MVHLLVLFARCSFAGSHARTRRAQFEGRARDFSAQLLRAWHAGSRVARSGVCARCRAPSEIETRCARPEGSDCAAAIFDRARAFPRSFRVIAFNTFSAIAGNVRASFLTSACMIELCRDLPHRKPE